MSAAAHPELARLLEHPAIWRGRSAARAEVLPTRLRRIRCLSAGRRLASHRADRDSRLPIRCRGVISPVSGACCTDSAAGGALVCLGGAASGALCAGVERTWGGSRANARGATERGERQRGNPQRGRSGQPESLWAFEQTLGSGASDIALAWATRSPRARAIRRLQLAAERGKTLGVLFRPLRAARESSAAVLRVVVEPVANGTMADGARITLLKSRGGARGSIDLRWADGWSTAGS